MTGKHEIDYEALAQDALRGIVRAVLLRVAISGLPGDHHLYIAFATSAPGVIVPRRLRERYPEEMTIVLQHQFSRLTVTEERFEVTLSFDNVPERLTVPIRAIRKFFDPSVPFGLQFAGSDLADEGLADLEPEGPGMPEPGRHIRALRQADQDGPAEPHEPRKLEKMRGPRKPGTLANDTAGAPATGSTDEASGPVGGQPPRRSAARPRLVKSKPDEPANDAKVVDLDKFRKK
jgi:uncharacterized protein